MSQTAGRPQTRGAMSLDIMDGNSSWMAQTDRRR